MVCDQRCRQVGWNGSHPGDPPLFKPSSVQMRAFSDQTRATGGMCASAESIRRHDSRVHFCENRFSYEARNVCGVVY